MAISWSPPDNLMNGLQNVYFKKKYMYMFHDNMKNFKYLFVGNEDCGFCHVGIS